MFSAVAQLALRALGPSDSPSTVVFWFQAGAGLVALAIVIATTGALPQMPPQHLWPLLGGIGMCATVGQELMTRAYSMDRAPVIATASYVDPVWAVFADFALFSVLPTWNAFVGGTLVVLAGLALLRGRDPVTAPRR